MTPAELSTALQALGVPSGYALAHLIGVEPRTAQKWLSGDSPIPEPVAILIDLIVSFAEAKDYVLEREKPPG